MHAHTYTFKIFIDTFETSKCYWVYLVAVAQVAQYPLPHGNCVTLGRYQKYSDEWIVDTGTGRILEVIVLVEGVEEEGLLVGYMNKWGRWWVWKILDEILLVVLLFGDSFFHSDCWCCSSCWWYIVWFAHHLKLYFFFTVDSESFKLSSLLSKPLCSTPPTTAMMSSTNVQTESPAVLVYCWVADDGFLSWSLEDRVMCRVDSRGAGDRLW